MFDNNFLITDAPFNWNTGTSGSGALSFIDLDMGEAMEILSMIHPSDLVNGIFNPNTAEAVSEVFGIDTSKLQLTSPTEVSFTKYGAIIFVSGVGTAELKVVKVEIEFMG